MAIKSNSREQWRFQQQFSLYQSKKREDNALATTTSAHLADEVVDVRLAVAGIAALVEAGLLGDPATGGGVELEGPEEGVALLEVLAAGVDLVDEVLNADDAVLAEGGLNDRVVGEGNTVAGELGIAALVDEVGDRLEVGGAPGDVGSDVHEHVQGGLVDAEEGGVVDLAQAEELEHLADLGGDAEDTEDTDDEDDLGLGRDVVLVGSTGLAVEEDVTLLGSGVLSSVLGSLLGDDGLLGGDLLGNGSLEAERRSSTLLLDALEAEEGLGGLDGSLSLGSDGAVGGISRWGEKETARENQENGTENTRWDGIYGNQEREHQKRTRLA